MWVVATLPHVCKRVKTVLEQLGYRNRTASIIRRDIDGIEKVLIPVDDDCSWIGSGEGMPKELQELSDSFTVIWSDEFILVPETVHGIIMRTKIREFLINYGQMLRISQCKIDAMMLDIPKKWEKYNDFVLLPSTAFCSSDWEDFLCQSSIRDGLFHAISEALDAPYIARKSRIDPDDLLRRPQITPLYGSFDTYDPFLESLESLQKAFWAHTIQHNIHYVWSPLHTMFSAGNVTEKERVALLPCNDEVIVDLYAGIGYFAFPYLKKAKCVIACEMNPWSVEGMIRGAKLNKIEYSTENNTKMEGLIVCAGNNKEFLWLYEKKADRVNMGLLPTSSDGLTLAVRALKDSGGWIHFHDNVLQHSEKEWESNIISLCRDLLNQHKQTEKGWKVTITKVELVKSFAPCINHLVADIFCE